ncbi:AAA family ATPase [Zhouia spongiae]|uniref:AAA family ATPase n=1 Tax=Zhouia spongiae TaxID=2202721 RepID=A0ABY3YJ82_9FLAO|nr:AAA family ATPase [Zhouia spongiae]UNY97879.1 AAA family ATPase [Zhouia spongiae]
MSDIIWDARLIGIKGARGVGKTTLMLQYIKLNLKDEIDKTLYVSLDSFWFSDNKLIDLVDHFTKTGGKYLFLDEVHKYPNWSQELKNIYDDFPELKIVFTGSSLLEILNARADLSRRAIVYNLQGLSFREYLVLETGVEFKPLTLPYILQNHDSISEAVLEKIRPLAYFQSYLKSGYYPYHFEGKESYYLRLREVVNLMLEIELPLLRGVDINYVPKIKQLLYIVSQSVPFIPNVSKLSIKINIQRTTLLGYMHYLEEVKLTNNLFKQANGISKLQKPSKIYLENTNLNYLLAQDKVDIGSLRETFFVNQLVYNHQLEYADKGDFVVDGIYTFEIGGKNKTNQQIKGMTNAFIAADEIEYGFHNKIPLWMFGFLY